MATMTHILQTDDKTYNGKIGIIGSTELGHESDYRYYVGSLHLDFGGSSQSYAPSLGGGSTEPNAAVHAHILAVLKAVGVRTWERLIGERVMALYESDDRLCLGQIVGICSLDGDNIYLLEALLQVDAT